VGDGDSLVLHTDVVPVPRETGGRAGNSIAPTTLGSGQVDVLPGSWAVRGTSGTTRRCVISVRIVPRAASLGRVRALVASSVLQGIVPSSLPLVEGLVPGTPTTARPTALLVEHGVGSSIGHARGV